MIRNTGCRVIYHALNGKSKSSSTEEVLGIDFDSYKNPIEYQYTPKMNWKEIEIHHVKQFSSFDRSNDEGYRETFNWKNTQPLLKEVHSQKGTNYDFLDYQFAIHQGKSVPQIR